MTVLLLANNATHNVNLVKDPQITAQNVMTLQDIISLPVDVSKDTLSKDLIHVHVLIKIILYFTYLLTLKYKYYIKNATIPVKIAKIRVENVQNVLILQEMDSQIVTAK